MGMSCLDKLFDFADPDVVAPVVQVSSSAVSERISSLTYLLGAFKWRLPPKSLPVESHPPKQRSQSRGAHLTNMPFLSSDRLFVSSTS